jgi:hypothetical protein
MEVIQHQIDLVEKAVKGPDSCPKCPLRCIFSVRHASLDFFPKIHDGALGQDTPFMLFFKTGFYSGCTILQWFCRS